MKLPIITLLSVGNVDSNGQRFRRNGDDECEVLNNVEQCTNQLLHDQLSKGFNKKFTGINFPK